MKKSRYKNFKNFTPAKITKVEDYQRSDLLEEIYDLLHEISEIKCEIAEPFVSLACVTVVPGCVALLVAADVLPYLATPLTREQCTSAIEQWFINSSLANFSSGARREAGVIVNNFENELLGHAKLFAQYQPDLSRQVGLLGVDEKNWTFPWLLNKLPAIGEQHLLFKIARLIDMRQLPESFFASCRNRFATFLVAIADSMPTMTVTRHQQQTLLPEFNGASLDLTAANISRFAEMIRFFYLNYIRDEILLEEGKNREVDVLMSRANLYFLIINVLAYSMLARSVLINPLFKRFFPLNWLLTRPLTIKKNYQQQDIESLQESRQQLVEVQLQLRPYGARAKTFGNCLKLLIFIVGLMLFFQTDNQLSAVFYLPLWIFALGEQGLYAIKSIYDRCRLESALAHLSQDIIEIAGIASPCLEIRRVNKNKIAFSYLTIIVKSKYEKLPREYISNLLKIALNHFGITLIASYSATRFSLPLPTVFKNIPLIKQFFGAQLDRSLQAYLLEKQIREIFRAIDGKGFDLDLEKQIILDDGGLTQCVFLIPHLTDNPPLLAILNKLGFAEQKDQHVLGKKTAFAPEEIGDIKVMINQLLPRRNFPELNEPRHKLIRQPLQPKQKLKTGTWVKTSTEAVDVEEEPKVWPCGATYPGKNVEQVAGGINEYIYWRLSLADFNNDQKIYDLYKVKSTQKAKRGHDAQGIKVRPTIAERKVGNGQRLFLARVKLLGKQGDSAVLLDIEKEQKGNGTLYIAQGYQSGGIH
jgi:hypothetical protein